LTQVILQYCRLRKISQGAIDLKGAEEARLWGSSAVGQGLLQQVYEQIHEQHRQGAQRVGA
jgi:hypothetical protein